MTEIGGSFVSRRASDIIMNVCESFNTHSENKNVT